MAFNRRKLIAALAFMPFGGALFSGIAIPAVAWDGGTVLAPLAPKRIKSLYEIANEIMNELHPFPWPEYAVEPDERTGNILISNRKKEPIYYWQKMD